MNALRVICDEGFGARRNVALTAAMLELREAGEIPDTLRIYSYPQSVLLGRNQVVEDALDLPNCRQRNIEVARRMTGGGAIYMDAGVITWDLVLARKVGSDFSALSTRVCSSIADELASTGVSARFRPENDIVISGKKVGGASGFSNGTTLVYQGSLLIAPDFTAMASALKLQKIAEVVTSLTAEAKSVRQAEITSVLSRSISRAVDCKPVQGKLGVVETARAAALFASEFGQDDFVFGGHDRIAA